MKKRSKFVALTLLGTSALALAACEEDRVQASVFQSEAACIAESMKPDADFDKDDCEDAFEEAERLHARTAPRYESLALCEAEHGPGQCGGDTTIINNNGGGSSFMPFMIGYMMAGGFDSSSKSRHYSSTQPVYKTKSGMYASATGTRFSSLNTTSLVSKSAVKAKPATTIGKPPMTKATVTSRGGFGASRTASTSSSRGG